MQPTQKEPLIVCGKQPDMQDALWSLQLALAASMEREAALLRRAIGLERALAAKETVDGPTA